LQSVKVLRTIFAVAQLADIAHEQAGVSLPKSSFRDEFDPR
jgi:hypothetical protein